MAPKSASSSKGKKPLIVSPPTKKRKSSIPEAFSSEDDVKTLLSQILGSVGELHHKTDLISERLVLLEEKVKEQKKKEIIFIKQWVGEKEIEGNVEIGEDEDEEQGQGAQGEEEDEKENEENNEADAEVDMEKEQEEGDDGKEDDEDEEEGEKEAAEFSSETKSNLPALSKGHRYGLRSRSSTKFSNTADQPIILTPSSSSAASNP